MITAERYHDFSAGHRVVGHESRCRWLHGHNYRVHFTCQAQALDEVGRVIDFSAIKSHLCAWLEEHWDHKFLAWEQDPIFKKLESYVWMNNLSDFSSSIVLVPFNPTAENIAEFLLRVVGPQQLSGTDVRLVKVVVDETRKCSAAAEATDEPKSWFCKYCGNLRHGFERWACVKRLPGSLCEPATI